MHKSIFPFLEGILTAWWAYVVGAAGGVIFLIQLFVPDFAVPAWVAGALMIGAVLLGAFVAFHKERAGRIRAEAEIQSRAESQLALVDDACKRLDVLAAECSDGGSSDFIHTALAAGAIVVKLRSNAAFKHDPGLEERIDVALRGQLLVQAGCKNPNDPAAQGEYQAFWAAREAACKRIGQTGHVQVSADKVRSGCHYVADDVRRAVGLPVIARMQ